MASAAINSHLRQPATRPQSPTSHHYISPPSPLSKPSARGRCPCSEIEFISSGVGAAVGFAGQTVVGGITGGVTLAGQTVRHSVGGITGSVTLASSNLGISAGISGALAWAAMGAELSSLPHRVTLVFGEGEGDAEGRYLGACPDGTYHTEGLSVGLLPVKVPHGGMRLVPQSAPELPDRFDPTDVMGNAALVARPSAPRRAQFLWKVQGDPTLPPPSVCEAEASRARGDTGVDAGAVLLLRADRHPQPTLRVFEAAASGAQALALDSDPWEGEHRWVAQDHATGRLLRHGDLKADGEVRVAFMNLGRGGGYLGLDASGAVVVSEKRPREGWTLWGAEGRPRAAVASLVVAATRLYEGAPPPSGAPSTGHAAQGDGAAPAAAASEADASGAAASGAASAPSAPAGAEGGSEGGSEGGGSEGGSSAAAGRAHVQATDADVAELRARLAALADVKRGNERGDERGDEEALGELVAEWRWL